MNQNMSVLSSVHVPDTILLSISWELCSKYIWVLFAHKNWCYILFGQWNSCPDVKKSPCVLAKKWTSDLYWVVCLPASVHMLVFISETVINLAKIAPSTVFYLSICFCKPVQYPVQSWRSTPSYTMICLNLQFFIIYTPTPPRCHTQSLRRR